jgi:hypothetical protein
MRSISPRQSQIMLTVNTRWIARGGRTITTEQGPAFFNQPRAGAHNGRAPLLFGGGNDRPMKNPALRRRSLGIHNLLLRLRDRYYPELCGQPPTSEWVGPMAFTPDALPAVGFVRPGVILAAGYNGYGGSYTTAAGQASAEMALTDESPIGRRRMSSPRAGSSANTPCSLRPRIISGESHRHCASGWSWSTNRSLRVHLRCDQRPGEASRSRSMRLERMTSHPGSTIKPDALRDFSLFADFSDRELRHFAAAYAPLGPAAGNCGGKRRWARRQLLHHRPRQR